MTKIKALKVSSGLTINIGNYESARIEIAMEVAPEEGEDLEETIKKVHEFLLKNKKKLVVNEINEIEKIREKDGSLYIHFQLLNRRIEEKEK
ncbi:MAG: hypothetical protein NC935_06300 [Candidatus Omnitrophica bacterium]|nr:hypothetical protein [Candidatus Omnitrophota bacterium]